MTEMKPHILEQCFSLRARIGWQGLRAEEFKEFGPYLVTGTDFENGKVNWDTCYHVTEDRFEQDKGIQLKEHDLLVTKDGTVGKTAFVVDCPEKTTLNSHIFLVRSTDGSVLPEYLYYVLNSQAFTDFMSNALTGTTIKGLTQEKFYKFTFKAPSVPEQEKIADVLAELDEVIDRTREIIEKYKKVRIGLLADLFTHKGNLEYADLGNYIDNITKKRVPKENDVCVNMNCIESGTGVLLEYAIGDLKSDKIEFKAGDVLFGKLRPYLKKYLYAGSDGLCSSEIMVFRANGIRDKYLYYIISSDRFVAYNNAKTFGTRMPRTSWKIVSKYQVQVPSLERQDEVIEQVESLDNKIALEAELLAKYMNMKLGLLQNLLSGRVDVSPLM